MRSPLALLPALTVALAAAAQCPAPPADPSGSGAQLPLARFGAGRAPYTYYGGISDSARLVVRDAAGWRASWSAVHRGMTPAPPLPTVNFATTMVIVAALGQRPSGGWGIVVDSAVARDGAVVVYVRTLAPGRGCFTSAALSSPVDLVALPRRDAAVRFSERRVREDCS